MKKYFHEFPSQIPIYGGDFSLIFTNDADICEEKFKGFEEGFVYAHALKRVEPSNIKGYEKNHYRIVLNLHYIEWMTHGSIAHEASHITNWIMKAKGIQWDPDNDEAQNYLLLYIVNLIYSHLEELKMLNRIKSKADK